MKVSSGRGSNPEKGIRLDDFLQMHAPKLRHSRAFYVVAPNMEKKSIYKIFHQRPCRLSRFQEPTTADSSSLRHNGSNRTRTWHR